LKPGNKIFGSQKESEKDDIFDDDVDLSFLENNEDEEQKLIEERRKRRQAILSKFSSKDSMSSLNTSSIASSTVADETPVAHPKSSDDQNGKNSCSKNVNVSAPPPSLSHSNSPAPFNLAKECTEKQPSVKSPAASDPESESSVFAADYDPTQDEREDDLRKIKGKTTGAPHPHKTQSELDILRSKDHDEQVKKTNNVDDADMFAADYSETCLPKILKSTTRSQVQRKYGLFKIQILQITGTTKKDIIVSCTVNCWIIGIWFLPR